MHEGETVAQPGWQNAYSRVAHLLTRDINPSLVQRLTVQIQEEYTLHPGQQMSPPAASLWSPTESEYRDYNSEVGDFYRQLSRQQSSGPPSPGEVTALTPGGAYTAQCHTPCVTPEDLMHLAAGHDPSDSGYRDESPEERMHRHQCQDFVCPGHDVHFDTDPIETSDSNSDSNSANDDDTSMDTSDHMTASNHPHTPTDLPSANLQGFNPLHSMQTDLKEESSWQESWQHLDIEMQAAETRDPHDSDAPQHLPNITNNISNLHNNTQDLHRQTDLHAPHRHSPERTSTRRSLRRPSPLRRPSSLPLLQTAGPESPSHRLRGFNGRRAAERDDTPLDYAPVEVERSPSSRVPHFNVQEAFMEVSSAEMSSSQPESSSESATTQQQQQLPHQGFPASNNDNDMQQPETQPNQGPTRSFMQHSQQQQHPSSSSASSMPHGMRFHPTEPPPYLLPTSTSLTQAMEPVAPSLLTSCSTSNNYAMKLFIPLR